jgi:hypothetical protein
MGSKCHPADTILDSIAHINGNPIYVHSYTHQHGHRHAYQYCSADSDGQPHSLPNEHAIKAEDKLFKNFSMLPTST